MRSPPTTGCPRCGTDNESTRRFCGNCGADMYPQAAGGTPAAPPSRGFPVWGIVAIIGGVVAVAAVITIVLVTRDSEPPDTATPPQEQTGGEQAGGEQVAIDQLAAYLPPEVTNCQNRSPEFGYEGWGAVLVCEPTSGDPVEVGFYLFESPEAAGSAYEDRLASTGITFDSGDCSIDSLAEHTWSGGGGQGRISCGGNAAGQAVLQWTSDAFPIVGTMVATTTDLTVPDLYTVWQGVSDYTTPA
jgi:hypothetical protein